jgi:hypothetical protein
MISTKTTRELRPVPIRTVKMLPDGTFGTGIDVVLPGATLTVRVSPDVLVIVIC